MDNTRELLDVCTEFAKQNAQEIPENCTSDWQPAGCVWENRRKINITKITVPDCHETVTRVSMSSRLLWSWVTGVHCSWLIKESRYLSSQWGYSEKMFQKQRRKILWLSWKLLNFNYKLFGGEIEETGRVSNFRNATNWDKGNELYCVMLGSIRKPTIWTLNLEVSSFVYKVRLVTTKSLSCDSPMN